jgi:hypothetical protein
MRGIIVLAEPGQCVSLVIPQLLLTDRFRLPFHSSQSPADTALGIGSIALVVPSSHAIAGILAFLYDLIKDCDCILTLAHCDQFISHVDQQFNVAIQVVFHGTSVSSNCILFLSRDIHGQEYGNDITNY